MALQGLQRHSIPSPNIIADMLRPILVVNQLAAREVTLESALNRIGVLNPVRHTNDLDDAVQWLLQLHQIGKRRFGVPAVCMLDTSLHASALELIQTVRDMEGFRKLPVILLDDSPRGAQALHPPGGRCERLALHANRDDLDWRLRQILWQWPTIKVSQALPSEEEAALH